MKLGRALSAALRSTVSGLAAAPAAMVDGAVALFAPRAALGRWHARRTLTQVSAYEAARPDKRRPKRRADNATGETHIARDAATCRAIARQMERDHDVAKGALDVLVRNVVGPNGISIEPQPRLANDDISDDLARSLLNLWRDFARWPEVTRTLDWVQAQQLACRSWLRDGDLFAQVVAGSVPGLEHGSAAPISLELLEADMVPLDYELDSPYVHAGIERNDWGRPLAYYVHRRHPGGRQSDWRTQLKRVDADRMLHVALRDRLSALRGVSIFASVIRRLEDLKDYEDSERIAARISAAIAAYVKRDKDMQGWSEPEDWDIHKREIALSSGAVCDTLAPGEELALLNPNRPNPNLGSFVDSQLRRGAAGLGMTYSALSRNYDGTYSAQRQELVEGWIGYRMLTSVFIARFARPVWERFVQMAIASGAVRVPAGVRPETVAQASFRGPVMPWIDPNKEAQALRLMVRAGFTSAQEVIAERGGRLQDTYEQLSRERKLAGELDLTLESDAATKGSVPGANNLDGDNAAGDEPPPAGQLNGATRPAPTGVH